jgi:hypothetical protein
VVVHTHAGRQTGHMPPPAQPARTVHTVRVVSPQSSTHLLIPPTPTMHSTLPETTSTRNVLHRLCKVPA